MHQPAVVTDQETCEEITECYRRFVSLWGQRSCLLPFQWQVTRHRCTIECDFVRYRDSMICQMSGNLHYCTLATCDRLEQTEGYQVCTLSGLRFDMELNFTNELPTFHSRMNYPGMNSEEGRIEDRDAGEVQTGMESDMLEFDPEEFADLDLDPYEEQAEPAETQAEDCDMLDCDHERRQTAQASSREQQTQQQVIIQAQIDSQPVRTAVFHSLLQKLFSAPIEATLCQSIISNCNRLWLLLHYSPLCLSERHRYKLEYHLLVVVGAMCAGYELGKQTQRLTVVPHSQWVEMHLPPVRSLKRVHTQKGSINVPAFTAASKTFRRSCMQLFQDASFRHKLCWQPI